jgi:hypothetical protein
MSKIVLKFTVELTNIENVSKEDAVKMYIVDSKTAIPYTSFVSVLSDV